MFGAGVSALSGEAETPGLIQSEEEMTGGT